MLIELITPLMLATAPVTLDAQTAVYDHKSQQVVALNESKDAVYGYGSTRTFSANGTPYDNDTD